MNPEQIEAAAAVLEWMSEHFMSLPEERKDGVSNGLACKLVESLCLEIVLHLHEGTDPYDAFVLVARGDRPIGGNAAA